MQLDTRAEAKQSGDRLAGWSRAEAASRTSRGERPVLDLARSEHGTKPAGDDGSSALWDVSPLDHKSRRRLLVGRTVRWARSSFVRSHWRASACRRPERWRRGRRILPSVRHRRAAPPRYRRCPAQCRGTAPSMPSTVRSPEHAWPLAPMRTVRRRCRRPRAAVRGRNRQCQTMRGFSMR